MLPWTLFEQPVNNMITQHIKFVINQFASIFSRAVITALLFKWGKNFGWNLTISHKVREIWENGTFWLAEMSGHMTLEWDLTEMYTTVWCTQHGVHAHDGVVCMHTMAWCARTRWHGVHANERKQLCVKPTGFLVFCYGILSTLHYPDSMYPSKYLAMHITDWLNNTHTGLLTDWLNHRLNDWLTDLLTDWLAGWLNSLWLVWRCGKQKKYCGHVLTIQAATNSQNWKREHMGNLNKS